MVMQTWYYEQGNDSLPFSEECSEDLERRFGEWEQRNYAEDHEVWEIKSGKFTYFVDFRQMTQENASTGKVRRIQRRLNAQGQQMDALSKQLKAVSAEKRRYKDAYMEATDSRAKLDKQLAELTSELKSSQSKASKLSRQVSGLEAQHAVAVQECAALRRHKQKFAEHEVWQFMNHVDSWQPYPAELAETVNRLYQQWQMDDHQERQTKVYTLKEDRWELDFGRMKQRNVRSNNERDIRLVSVSFTPDKVLELQNNVSRLQQELIDKESSERQLMATSDQLRSQLQAQQVRAADQASHGAEEAAKLKQVVEALRGELGAAREGQHSAENEREELRQQLAALAQRDEMLRQSEVELQIQKEARQAEKARHLEELSKKEQQLTLMQESKHQVEDQLKKLRKEFKELMAAMKNCQVEVAAKQKLVDDTQKAMQKKDDELAKRVNRVNEKKQQVRQCMTEEFLKQFVLQHISKLHLLETASEYGRMEEAQVEELLRKTVESEKDLDKVMASWVQKARSWRQSLTVSPQMLQLFGDLDASTPWKAQELDKDSADWHLVDFMFQSSLAPSRLFYNSEEWCEKAELEIVSISFVESPEDLRKKYDAECQRMRNKAKTTPLCEPPFGNRQVWRPQTSTEDINEVLVFHGTPWDSVESIRTKGFEWQRAGENKGSSFGRAVYFAPNASKCDLYSSEDSDGRKVMFLARVVLGSCFPRHRYCAEVKQPPKDFNSIVAVTKDCYGAVDHPEVAVFQKAACLPVALIIYKHKKPTCQCTLCRREQERA
ncbi:PARP15 [Symbiodinium sp. CCMP2592]|nr:PARP15 [Symbiodinium sp. CCMP2592]